MRAWVQKSPKRKLIPLKSETEAHQVERATRHHSVLVTVCPPGVWMLSPPT